MKVLLDGDLFLRPLTTLIWDLDLYNVNRFGGNPNFASAIDERLLG